MKYVKDDLLSATEGYIVHGCNCQGVMGSGVALAIRKKYPLAYLTYLEFCSANDTPRSLLGKTLFVPVTDKLIVINAFTQLSYGRDGKLYASYQAIDEVMHDIGNNVKLDEPIHMPKIGCGLGGGDWKVVERMVEHSLANHNVTVYEL